MLRNATIILFVGLFTGLSGGANAQCSAGELPAVEDICSVQPLYLSTLLSGAFDEGGKWLMPDNSLLGDGIFNPLLHPAGSYSYVVVAGECSDTATVLLQTNDQGILGDFFSCSLNPFFLQNVTQINPPSGTMWYDPNGTVLNNGWVNPALNPPGIYTGVYTDVDGCAVFAHVDLDFPNTLTRETLIPLNMCISNPLNVWMMELLGSHAVNYVGDWNFSSVDGTQTQYLGQAWQVYFNPANDPDGYYIYSYLSPHCNQLTSDTLYIQTGTAVTAGSDASLVRCQSGEEIVLTDYLGGNPSPGLFWFNENGEQISEVFSFQNDTTATFYYTDPDNICAGTAYLDVEIIPSEVSTGVSTSVSFCNSDDAVPLLQLLNGNPDSDGYFTNPFGEVVTYFDPSSDPTGNYLYHIENECGTVTTKLTIKVFATPNPGVDTVATLCPEDAGIVNLLAMVGGSPDGGGHFITPGGNMLFGTIVNLGNYTGGDFTYEISLGGCVRSSILTIDYFDGPEVFLGADTTLCTGDEITLDAGPGVSFMWNTGDSGPVIPVGSEGFYSVVVTDVNGCQGSDGIYISVDAGCQTGISTSVENHYTLFPNPATGTVYLSVPVAQGKIHFELYSLTGKHLLSKVFAGGEGEKKVVLPENLESGTYVVAISNGNDRYTDKLILIK